MRADFFDAGGDAAIKVKYSGPDTGGGDVTLRAAPPPAATGFFNARFILYPELNGEEIQVR